MGLGGLGLQPVQGANMPQLGIEYVVASPQGQAVLRPLRYPLYDTELLATTQSTDITLFTDHKKFNVGGASKTECDTNMTLDAQLGSPNLFDLVGFTGEIELGVSQADFNDIYSKMTFRWVFGQNTYFTRVRLIKIPQGIGPYGFNTGGTIITNGLPVVSAFYNFTTPDRRARRIDSTEQFRNELHPCSALSIQTAGRKWTTYMYGVYYSNL
jgi:hypothetical protein